MKLGAEQLGRHLEGKLAKAYVVSGDEPLQCLEAADAIRQKARLQGFTGHERFQSEIGFDWGDFKMALQARSLFGEPRIIDLRLSSKPDRTGTDALAHFIERPPEDALLLLSLPRLTATDQKAKWFQGLEQLGVFIQVWPLDGDALIRWLDRRLNQKGLLASQGALRLLAARVEGNLLAAAQEIEKLHILHGKGQLEESDILKAVADLARYDVFDLSEEWLKGDLARAIRVLEGLKAEGIAEPVVLWSITREVRLLMNLRREMARGQRLDALASRYRLWDTRLRSIQRALERLSSRDLEDALGMAFRADQTLKGLHPGESWHALLELIERLARPTSRH